MVSFFILEQQYCIELSPQNIRRHNRNNPKQSNSQYSEKMLKSFGKKASISADYVIPFHTFAPILKT
jgi:predicted deacylase